VKEITLPILLHTKIGIEQLLVFLKETSICTKNWHIKRLKEEEEEEDEEEV